MITERLQILRQIFSPIEFRFSVTDVIIALRGVEQEVVTGIVDKENESHKNAKEMRQIFRLWTDAEIKEENKRRPTNDKIPELRDLGSITNELVDSWEQLYQEHFVKPQLEDVMGQRTEAWENAMDNYIQDVVEGLTRHAASVQEKDSEMWDMVDHSIAGAPAKAMVMLSAWSDTVFPRYPLPCNSMFKNLARTWNIYPGAIMEVRISAKL